jgi:hypothetical protein
MAVECLVAARPDPGPLGWAGVAFRNAKNHSHQTSPAQHSWFAHISSFALVLFFPPSDHSSPYQTTPAQLTATASTLTMAISPQMYVRPSPASEAGRQIANSNA